MSKRLILVLALAFVVGIAFAAYAEVQNVKVSGDIDLHGIARSNLTLKDNESVTNYGESISAAISQVRVRIDADLTDNVSTTVRLLNERVWGAEDDATTSVNDDTGVDLDLAYVSLKEFLYSPLTLTLGRQELRFGNALIVGDPDTNGVAAGTLPVSLGDLSKRKAFDAIRAVLNYDPLVVDLIYSKIDENNIARADDINLYGVNAAYAVNKNLNADVYLWQRTRKATGTATLLGNTQAENLRTAGAKATYTGIENLSAGLEGAFQFGDHISNATLYPNDLASNATAVLNRKVTAYAIQATANYALPKVKYTPTVGGSYTYLSGDKYLSNSDNYRGWDPMFEDQAGGTLFNKILGYSNAQLFNANTSLKPMDDLTVALNYYYLQLNQPYTGAAVVRVSGVTGDPTYTMKGGKKSLGNEIDLGLTYDYTEDVQIGLNTGAFIPGEAFDKANKKTATQVIGSMKVTF